MKLRRGNSRRAPGAREGAAPCVTEQTCEMREPWEKKQRGNSYGMMSGAGIAKREPAASPSTLMAVII